MENISAIAKSGQCGKMLCRPYLQPDNNLVPNMLLCISSLMTSTCNIRYDTENMFYNIGFEDGVV
jgi:hypothetical protein